MSILKNIILQNETARKVRGDKICSSRMRGAVEERKLLNFSQIFKKMIARTANSVYNN